MTNEKENFSGIARIYIYTITAPAICWALNDSTSFNPEQVQVQAANNAVPIGTVIVWTKEEIPEGWLECNGQPVPDMYPDLKALMPTVPNYQGMFLRGAGSQTLEHGKYGVILHPINKSLKLREYWFNKEVPNYANKKTMGQQDKSENRHGRASGPQCR